MARAHVEDDLQTNLVTHLQIRGVRGLVFWHTPNGGRRNKREAGRLKAMGVRPGVSDLILFHEGRLYALELKAPGGRPSDAQIQFMNDIEDAGAIVEMCTGLDAALRTLEAWNLLVGKTK